MLLIPAAIEKRIVLWWTLARGYEGVRSSAVANAASAEMRSIAESGAPAEQHENFLRPLTQWPIARRKSYRRLLGSLFAQADRSGKPLGLQGFLEPAPTHQPSPDYGVEH
jgi:hypothetical protein